MQGFLDYFQPGGTKLQDKLVKAACTLYPWGPMLPPPAQVSGGADGGMGRGGRVPLQGPMLPPPAQGS